MDQALQLTLMLTLRSNMSLVSSEMPPESEAKGKLQETWSKLQKTNQLTTTPRSFNFYGFKICSGYALSLVQSLARQKLDLWIFLLSGEQGKARKSKFEISKVNNALEFQCNQFANYHSDQKHSCSRLMTFVCLFARHAVYTVHPSRYIRITWSIWDGDDEAAKAIVGSETTFQTTAQNSRIDITTAKSNHHFFTWLMIMYWLPMNAIQPSVCVTIVQLHQVNSLCH